MPNSHFCKFPLGRVRREALWLEDGRYWKSFTWRNFMDWQFLWTDSLCCWGGRREETTTGTKEGEPGASVCRWVHTVCCRGLAATRSGVHPGATQQEMSTCFRVKISRLELIILTFLCWTKQSDSQSSLSLSSKRGNLISLVWLVFSWASEDDVYKIPLNDLNLAGGFFGKQKARDHSAWWPLQEESIAAPPLFSCWGCGSIATKLNKQTKR